MIRVKGYTLLHKAKFILLPIGIDIFCCTTSSTIKYVI